MTEILCNELADLDRTAATALTDRIRSAVEGLASMLAEAHDRRAWKALGYASWEAYVRAEFAMSRGRSYQLLDQSRVIEAVREASGDLSTKVDITEREARAIKADLPAVAAKIRERVGKGEAPATAIAETVAASRATDEPAKLREAKAQRDSIAAHNSRLIDEIREKSREVRSLGESVEALTAEIEEKAEYIAALEGDIAALRAEIKLFDEMKVQWQQGGYEAVIAGMKEVIRVQATRIERESHDKDSWATSAKYFRAEAIKLGWSRNTVIDLETGEIVQGAA